MARDIEEFLRRATERRQQKQGQPSPPPPVQPKPPRSSRSESRGRLADRSLGAGDAEPYRELPRSKEAGASKPAPPRPQKKKPRQSVADHVRESIVVSDVTERSSHFAEQLELVDEKADSRMSKFDHKLGDLQRTDPTWEEQTESTADLNIANDLMELLKNPKTIREAILVSEILKRPNFDD